MDRFYKIYTGIYYKFSRNIQCCEGWKGKSWNKRIYNFYC